MDMDSLKAVIRVEGASMDAIISALGIRRSVLVVQIRWREGYKDGHNVQLPGCRIDRFGHTTVECEDTESAVREFRRIMRERARDAARSSKA